MKLIRSALIGLLALSPSRQSAARGLLEAEADSRAAFAQVRDGEKPVALLDLGGRWEFRSLGGDEVGWMPATVPSTVQMDLLRAGKIPDPFYRDNELRVQWIEKKEWEYRRRFRLTKAFLRHDRILLECRGLDTIAEVYLNGSLVARTINMFIEHEFDVKPLLRAGENEVRVVLRSVLEWISTQMDQDPRTRAICAGSDERTDCLKGLTFVVRKEASDFGWDWAPRILTSGIWKPIRLVAYDSGRIRELSIRQDLSDPTAAVLHLAAEVESFGGRDLQIRFEVSHEGTLQAASEAAVSSPQVGSRLVVRNPRRWWPNGWGEHPLYTVRATLQDRGRVVHEKTLRIGLRTIELVRDKDAAGEGFAFRVNGQPIFAKGANWVPLDALPDRLSQAHYRHVLRSAVEANMNMLRVWGGGLYEPDVFYEFCDENGILLWHDFMFATGPYIATEPYLKNVRAEIKSVVLRRRHHASIALWCGNNESEANMAAGQSWPRRYPTATWEEYDKVFHEAIPRTLALHDPDRPYWPSSPHHPLDRKHERQDWESASGDTHDWEVWHEGKGFSAFEQLAQFRFVSEFGFEGMPTLETIRSFTAPEDRSLNSYVMDHHEKTGRMKKPEMVRSGPNRGTARIARYVGAYFRMPARFEDWVYVSQVLQGEAMRLASEALRRNSPRSTGALYWQLGDNWPVVSNSSIDYYGRWKAVHYMARRFFSPVLVSPVVEGTSVRVFGVNDRLETVPAVLRWVLGRLDGTEVRRGESTVTLPPNASRPLAELVFTPEVGEDPAHQTYRNDSFANASRHYFHCRLVGQDGQELSSNVSFFAPAKYLQLEPPGLWTRVTREGGRSVVRVGARRFAAWVELGLAESYARFGDNYFHLLPGEERTIAVVASEVPEEDLPRRLRARSLAESY